MSKVVVIGLDGVGWNLLDYLMKEGLFPNLEKLREESLFGDLESSVPPVTFPAWKCLSTGKDPSSLGVYWWMNLDYNNRKFHINTSRDFRCKEIWDYLSENGLRSIVINTPGTYPVKRINGIMISGQPNPDITKSVYPSSLIEDLLKYGWENMPDEPWAGGSRKVIEECIDIHRNQVNYALDLMENESWDFFQYTFFLTDPILHHFWDEHKNISDRNRPKIKALRKFWMDVDKYIYDFYEKLDDETYLFIVSDHGMTEMKYKVRLNHFLRERGYLRLNRTSVVDRVGYMLQRKKLVELVERTGFLKLTSKFLDYIGISEKINPASDISLREDLIDWEETRAICLSDCWGLIYTNNLDESNKQNLIKELSTLQFNGEHVLAKILDASEVYSNVEENTPSIIVVPKTGYEIVSGLGNATFKHKREDVWSSTHARSGLYLINGSNIPRKKENHQIYDIAPTILYLFNLIKDVQHFDGNIIEVK